MALYGAAVFLGAFLLFQVQLLAARALLPAFGGSAAVWTACLLFFQAALLLGYLYAHALAGRLSAARQALVHSAVLLAGLPVVPLALRAAPAGPGQGDPAAQILLSLLRLVGLPYMALAATSPLLQAWAGAGASAGKRSSPYRLYALSNAGSLLGLLGYPLLVEPALAVRQQWLAWECGYAVFAALCVGCGARYARQRPADRADPVAPACLAGSQPAPAWGVQLLWVVLPACASVLLLAVTQFVTQDVAPVPLLWVLPLALYLLTFILSFEGRRWYRRALFVPLLVPAAGGVVYAQTAYLSFISIRMPLLLSLAGLFVCCMVCHGELAALKPGPRLLTRFYLLLAAGGALGGLFVSVMAPRLFSSYRELPAGIAACMLLVAAVLRRNSRDRHTAFCVAHAWPVLALAGIGLAAWAGSQRRPAPNVRAAVRGFYGCLEVRDTKVRGEEGVLRRLSNGVIWHGAQWQEPARRREPSTYYSTNSGVGRAILARRGPGAESVGVVGLGAGSLAAYARAGDRFCFYEIDPLVVRVARSYFTYLSDAGGAADVRCGDGRLLLAREPSARFDVLAIDAFSGDSIPVHLLTREAFAVYFRVLKPDGILAVHITNRFLDLRPVAAQGAASAGRRTVIVDTNDGPGGICATSWVLAGRPEALAAPELRGAFPLAPAPGFRPWTDDFSSILAVIRQ